MAPLHLGIRAVIAKSFARIHRRNLIAQGILPLVFADDADYDAIKQGDAWTIDAVRESVASGERRLTARNDANTEIPLEAPLLAREREILLAGGMLRHLREGGQERIGIVEGDTASAETGGYQTGGRSS